MSALGVIIGEIVTDFQPAFAQVAEAAAIELFRFKATPNGFSGGIIGAVATPAPALQGSVAGQQGLEGGGGVLAALVRMYHEPGGGLAYGQGPAQRLADQVFGHGLAYVPPDDFARVTVEPRGQVEPATALFGQVGDVAYPDLVRRRGGRLARQAVGSSAHGRVRIGRAGHKRARLLGQARRSPRPPDAPTAHPMALGVQLGPQAAGTIAGRMPPKLHPYRDLPGWLGGR